ncbi:hypothetical protein LOZ80_13875 [Paenibacillus sp. HWE-109]|uniref:CBO0543 family protein n=1 Tax=Paenibacillus sp. HWE-109 TaxID=1306526 RepID=UPI001EDF6ED2|nr:CBO0543 family protein [Paenibacillus sp. HWE-109]UKS29960.1 hypothetical protein LOZ80_13875 [Paenibacillus sp. HWE-109]
MLNEIENLTKQLHQMEMSYWFHHDIFTFQWWFIVVVNVLFFLALLFLLDKGRALRIMLAFMLSFVILGTFDQIGQYFELWSYAHEFIAFTENYNAVDFLAIPSIFALTYQMFTSWRIFLVASLFVCLFNAFIAEPIFVALDIYHLDHWNYFGSFIILYFVVILVKALTDLVGRNNTTDDYRSTTQQVFQRKQKAR